MRLAKTFFVACAGVLFLGLAFHLGAISGHAQVGMVVEGASIESFQPNTFPRATACVNRYFRWMGESGGPPQVYPVPVPGVERIVATDPYGTVLLENGDWLRFDGTGWVLIGNLAGGATPATRETWGQLKARFRW